MTLKIREYARRCSCSHVLVLTAIRDGRLKNGLTPDPDNPGSFLIKVAEADTEWGNAIMTRKGVTPLNHTPPSKIPRLGEIPPSKGARGMSGEIPPSKGAGGMYQEPAAFVPIWDGTGDIPADIPYSEALRIKEIQNARLKRLELDEKNQVLVKKSEINAQLFTAGTEIRKALDRYPSRSVDLARGAKTRHEAITLMTAEMETTLHEVTEIILRIAGIQPPE